MPLDLFTLKPLVAELDARLSGGKVDKIMQPEEDEIRLFIRNGRRTECLVASASPRAPRLHITQTKRENPLTAFDFCMLLRKYLCGSVLKKVEICGNDRMVRLVFRCLTELLDEKDFFLYVELMNRYSNIVLADCDDVTVDAIKRIPLDIEHEKCVLPHVKYKLSPQPKTPFCTAEAVELLTAFDGSSTLREYLQANMSGFAVSTLLEFFRKAKVPAETRELVPSQTESLKRVLAEFSSVENSKIYAPCHTEGEKGDFFAFPYEGTVPVFDDSLNNACDLCISKVDAALREQSKKRVLTKLVTAAVKRLEKSISINRDKLAECDGADEYRVQGELLTCNLHKIKKGDSSVEVDNYYSGEKQIIKLDELKSPSQNATAYYNKYQKLKRARAHLVQQLDEKTAQLEYLRAVGFSIEELRLDESMSEIETELQELGLMRKKGGKRREKPSLPLRYEYEGFCIMKGRNNLQNDNLTFKTANSGDLWLHVKAAHGGHVIVFAEGRSIPESVVLVAAEIAASGSKARIDVDYTARRNVKRKPGGYAGMVNYVDYRTVTVEPNGHSELLINK